jgi:ADP-heptose:LPS heptosyltransferase
LQKETGIVVERLEDIDNTNDIDGLAALITACDLVTTVSNTTAHLAGALGKPTVVFVPFGRARIWYWFKEGSTCPWYPRLRLKRAVAGQSWEQLVSAAAGEIADLLAATQRSQ